MIERTRCWLVPMRPVTPFITTPIRRVPAPLRDGPSVLASTAMENVCQPSGGRAGLSTGPSPAIPGANATQPRSAARYDQSRKEGFPC